MFETGSRVAEGFEAADELPGVKTSTSGPEVERADVEGSKPEVPPSPPARAARPARSRARPQFKEPGEARPEEPAPTPAASEPAKPAASRPRGKKPRRATRKRARKSVPAAAAPPVSAPRRIVRRRRGRAVARRTKAAGPPALRMPEATGSDPARWAQALVAAGIDPLAFAAELLLAARG